MTPLTHEERNEADKVQLGERAHVLLAGRGGYHPFNKWSEWFYSLCNMLMSLVLIFVLSPLFLLLAIILKINYRGGSILYSGVRLGRYKRPFVMYKFRTLPVDAQQIIGDSLLSSSHSLTTPFTEFLRSTRLDELPQLFNVLKRDMDLNGPRPERPEVYQKLCRHLKGYDLRFSVRPGLIGYSQLFTPHSAPKRLRVLIDNKYVAKRRNLLWDIGVLFFVACVLIKTIVLKLTKEIRALVRTRCYRQYREQRKSERHYSVGARAFLRSGKSSRLAGPILDINSHCMKIVCSEDLASDDLPLQLEILIDKGNRLFPKRALCTGKVFRRYSLEEPAGANIYVIEYTPRTPLNHYIIDQYFLKKSIA